MSLSKPNPLNQNMEQSENLSNLRSSCPVPVACCVCDKVFSDNVSLVLHFECHLKDEMPSPWQHVRDLAPSQSRNLSIGLSQVSCSSLNMMNGNGNLSIPRMNEYFKTWSLPVSLAITPNVTPINVSLVNVPLCNFMPPINSSFGAGWNSSQPFYHSNLGHSVERLIPDSTMGQYKVTSPLTDPSLYSQSGVKSFADGMVLPPPLQLRGQKREQECFYDIKNPQINQFKKPVQEIVVVSDDEKDDMKDAAEIDLTLRL